MTDFEIEVIDGRSYPAEGAASCTTITERLRGVGPLVDVVAACSPRWLSYAVTAALRGELPRTRCYVVPSRTGGLELAWGPDIRIARPQCFSGLPHLGAEADPPPDPHGLPEHEALAPRRRVQVEDAGDVLFDDFESMDWPAIRAPGGAA